MYGVEWFSMMRDVLRQKTKAQIDWEKVWNNFNKENQVKQVTCDCSVANACPQGRIGIQSRCKIWVKEEKKMLTVIMGKTTDEWSKIVPAPEFCRIFKEEDYGALLKWANREKPMTREEALKLVNHAGYDIGTDSFFANERQFVACLEKLGLIKFEEEKKVYITIEGYTLYWEAIVKAVVENGYKIVKDTYVEQSLIGYKVAIDLIDHRLIPECDDGNKITVVGRLNKIQRTG